MAFGFDENTKDAGASYMLPGINRNELLFPELADVDTYITKLEFLPSDGTTSSSLQITMRDSKGRVLENRIFDPSTGEYAGEKQIIKTMKVFANLTRKFLGEDYIVPAQPSFEAFCKKIIADIGNKYENVALRTKVVLNKNGYSKLPSYAPIWELASVPPEKSCLSISDKFDIIKKEEEQTSRRSPEDLDSIFGTAGTSPERLPTDDVI